MRKNILTVLAGLSMAAAAGTAIGGDAEQDTRARAATVRCGGSQFLRSGGAEIHFTSYIFRNYDPVTPITVNRMTFFDATGAVLYDTDVSGFPAFDNAVLGPGDNVIEPNQTAQLTTLGFLPLLPDTQRPIQVEIDWSAPERALTLDVAMVRISRQRDPLTGQLQAERGRHAVFCRTVRFGDRRR